MRVEGTRGNGRRPFISRSQYHLAKRFSLSATVAPNTELSGGLLAGLAPLDTILSLHFEPDAAVA